MYAIEALNISKRFRDQTVLDDVSLQVEKGKIYGLVGDNGSGKSVLLKCLCGIIPCDKGEIRIAGKTMKPGKGKPPILGIVIEHPGFLDSMSGWHNLKYLAGIRGIISDEQIRKALQCVGLIGNEKKKVKKYSLGMRQRLAIAQAIMENPDIYIMDEPFNGLDKHAVEDMRTLFSSMREKGKTFLLVSHYAADIENLCDEVFEINDGMIKKGE
ncbi:MAG: ABC transporter ATP-binding protein [Oscillospiraceae bacterium]|nr:ABC transporter ATP-binding protein [Oscillospiraceae bacterium]